MLRQGVALVFKDGLQSADSVSCCIKQEISGLKVPIMNANHECKVHDPCEISCLRFETAEGMLLPRHKAA